MLSRMMIVIFVVFWVGVSHAEGESLCFSPVAEKEGDKNSERKWWQAFDYRVQLDDGPVIKPSPTVSTSYEYSSELPVVKIWFDGKVVQSFKYQKQWLDAGRDCIYFKSVYETWSVVEKWQAEKLCACAR